jgi:endonuclease/exonuclease/phosphatase family metal-dependent hydrolase
MKSINKLALFLVFSIVSFHAQAQKPEREIIVGFYNCENLFDPADDPQKNDDEFTPTGRYHYTEEIYRKRLVNMAAVIDNMSPAVLGMAEVENAEVLAALTTQPALAKRGYKYILRPGPDPRGINVALLYDPAQFKLTGSESLPVNIAGTGGKEVTRDVLHVQGTLAGEKVNILVNHWPSRRGGIAASDGKREAAALVNKAAVEAAAKKDKNAAVIVMGDLNDNPDDSSVTYVLGAVADRKNVTTTGLFNPFAEIYLRGGGTEVYRKHWNLFDQVIVSGTLVKSQKLRYDHAEVFMPSFIQDTYKGHEGEPHRAFRGTKWINGYSDHYPVAVYFKSSAK